MGGLPAGRVANTQHHYALGEKRVDALMTLLSAPQRRLLKVDELRRNIEALGPQAYDAMGYYERWMHAICQTLSDCAQSFGLWTHLFCTVQVSATNLVLSPVGAEGPYS